MFVTKELLLHENVSIRVTIANYYLITDVFLVVNGISRDRPVEFKYRLEEPYERMLNHVLDCKKYGVVLGKKDV